MPPSPTANGRSGTRRVTPAAALVVLSTVFMSSAGCRPQTFATGPGQQGLSEAVHVRDIRVLLVDGGRGCRIRIDRPFTIRTAGGESLLRGRRVDWTVVRADPVQGIAFGQRVLGHGVFDLRPEGRNGAIQLARPADGGWSAPGRYPGFLRVRVDEGGRLQVVNVLDIEQYVACVLPGELFPHFEPEAYRAQAVAVRTYALYQMARRGGRPYDLRSSAQSQVYGGLQAGGAAERAREATDYTRGVVATWTSPVGERIFCTFYSSCCGGLTQDVANCRSDVASIPPLSGDVRCDCLTVARGKTYRWPAVRLPKDQVTAKLVARYPKLERLGPIEHIEVVDRTPSGRMKVLRLIGGGSKYDNIVAEDFRLAVGSMTLRSTNCRIKTEPEHFVFTNGTGFGHGMGMCQWGMQAMALQGWRGADILKHYYPTANLTRAY